MTMAAGILEPSLAYSHLTVLRDEVVKSLGPLGGRLYVDATAGGGGHSEAILEANEGVRVIACDRDPVAVEACRRRLARFGERAMVWHARFDQLELRLLAAGVVAIDGLVADLGVSSQQLDDPERGLSFRTEGPLDMRMDRGTGETALELLRHLDAEELANVIYRYGDERRSRRIARCIKLAGEAGELTTTLDLRRAVVKAVGPRRIGGIDPATRTFQALRMAVNREMEQLSSLLSAAASQIRPGGRIAFISFHSLEDRMVKRALLDGAIWQRVSRKPIIPSSDERARNPRCRSAKLRVAIRLTRGDVAQQGLE